jgi:Cu+-exporting ATPase
MKHDHSTHDHGQRGKEHGSCCSTHGAAHTTATAQMHIDPVCGMTVKADPAKSAEHGGKTYYFCSQGCVTKFRANPEQYLT